jgi:hypothetical protein
MSDSNLGECCLCGSKFDEYLNKAHAEGRLIVLEEKPPHTEGMLVAITTPPIESQDAN